MFSVSPSTNLNFSGAKGNYATHAVHSYSAKFPPQLPKWAIENYTGKGDVVFDPFVGSGTTFVEAKILGRNCYGTEIDPLSRLISQVKCTPIDPLLLNLETESLLVTIAKYFRALQESRNSGKGISGLDFPLVSPEFPNRDYWYFQETVEELALLLHLINQVKNDDIKRFLYVVFSSIIYTKGKSSMANVMDLAHSRPHRVMKETPPDVEIAFLKRLQRLRKMMFDLWEKSDATVKAKIVGSDARDVPALADESIDLVFTSPPYVNAIDYQRGHKFSLFWLAESLGITPEDYISLGKEYIGNDRIPKNECDSRIKNKFGVNSIDAPVRELAEKGFVKKAGVVHAYFDNMRFSLCEMLRVAKTNRPIMIVVAASNIKGVEVNTPQAIKDLAEQFVTFEDSKFYCQQIVERKIDRDKRQLPVTRGIFGDGMKTESIVILQKVR